MPRTPDGVFIPAAKIPPRDPQREADLINEAIHEVRRGLILNGIESDAAAKLIARFREHFTTEQKGAGPQLRVRAVPGTGAGWFPRSGLGEFVEQLVEVARLDSFGPDPAQAVRDRLIAIDVPPEEAEALVKGRVRRLPTGEMEFRPEKGQAVVSNQEVDEETGRKSIFHEDNFVTYAAKSLMRERERSPNRPLPQSSENILQEKRATGNYSL